MRTDFGYFEERKLGKPYDLKLLGRLLPFVRPYRMFLFCSVLLVLLITFLELSIPYVTKIAIDHYIVPTQKTSSTADTDSRDLAGSSDRYLSAEADSEPVQQLISRFPDQIAIEGDQALIPYRLMAELDAKVLRELRQNDVAGLNRMVAVFLGIILLNFGCNFLQIMAMEYTGHRIMHDMRMALYAHIQRLSISFFNQNPVGRLVTRVTNDVQNMHELFTSVITFVFKDLILLVGIAVVMIYISWKLALATFMVLPLVVYASFRFADRAREVFRELRVKIAEINSLFAETVGGIRVVQLFLNEVNTYRRFARLNHENYLAGMRQIRLLAVFMPLVEFLGVVTIAIIVYYGGYGVLEDSLSLGALVAFISYIRMFYKPIRDIAEKYNLLQNAMASAERIFLIFDDQKFDQATETGHYPWLPAPSSRRAAEEKKGADKIRTVAFQEVSFAYVAGEPVLKTVSFELKEGQTLAVVGPTGAGKSTLMYLLSGFFRPTGGAILINGQDMLTSGVHNLRRRMAIVMQDPFLFSTSIRDNLFSQTENWSQARINEILEASNCRDFIERLPHGLDTVLSEAGGSLSSGQRQLLCIARAFAHNPDLIVLDEATSYIDSETEVKIQSAIGRLMQRRTCIVIAHRLSTARAADHIIVLHRHRILERGSHSELIKAQGFYYRLHQAQSH